MTYKYEQEILDKGIFFKQCDFDSGVFPDKFKNISGVKGGYGIYQHPLQLSRLLEWLEMLDIKTYVEIGIYFGGTFQIIDEHLRAINPELHSYGIENSDLNWNKRLNAYLDRYPEHTHYIRGNSTKVELPTSDIDLCFIDGNHNMSVIANDFLRFGVLSRICLFHDINAKNVPDVRVFWDKVKITYGDKNYFEINDGYQGMGEHFGIGVLVKDNQLLNGL